MKDKLNEKFDLSQTVDKPKMCMQIESFLDST